MTTTDTNGSDAVARQFPEGFLWGVATSAYQIEGAAHSDGRGPSVWDTFSHTPGKVRGGDTGDIACDFYHRSEGDLDLIAGLGIHTFRFSISWPRIQPTGQGSVNQPGLDFYRSLVENLHSRDIAPAITLFHWDLPQALEDVGGWANRDTAERFAEYAYIVAEGIGDVGGMWITLNEPQVVAHEGYRIGKHAPGHCDYALAAAATHHMLLGHGLAVEQVRSAIPNARVGITLDLHVVRAVNAEAEAEAKIRDAEENRIFFEPVVHGSYPAAARDEFLPPPSLIHDGDMKIISAPIDFLGVNYYSPHYVKVADPAGLHADETAIPGRPGAVLWQPQDLPRTAMGWLIEPNGLYDTLVMVAGEVVPGCSIYVTENGCASDDYITPEGVVNDLERIEYLHGHLTAAWRAIQDGVPLAGYFYWSLHDNFEWAWGYQKRFGLVFVEYDTQRRIPKRSAAFYQDVVAKNELPPLDLNGAAVRSPSASA
jgi:beta-glucosidase